MAADRATWEKRVSEWRASGLSSLAYCEGKPFSPGGLRYWAHRINRGGGRSRRSRSVVRLVRVRRVHALGQRDQSDRVGDAIVVQVGSARVEVRPGHDRATLAGVLEVLMRTATGEQ